MNKYKKLIPKRRFKEFINAGVWEQCKLGEVVEICSGRDYKHLSEGNIPVYGTGGYMLSVNQALSYNKDAIGIGRKGTIDKPYILNAPFWTVDTLFYALPRGNMDLNFAFDIFKNIDWKKNDESTGVPSLSKTAINDINIFVPKSDEQQAIGQLFSRVDNLITLHQRKLNKVKALKKAYLKEMFPAAGERKPKRRFPGFTDDWEQRKLLDSVIKVIDFRGRTPRKLGLDWSESGYLALSALNVKNGYIDESIDAHYGSQELYDKWMVGNELHKGQVLFTTEAPMGNVAQVPDNKQYILSQRTIAFEVDERKITEDYLATVLRSPSIFNNLTTLSSGGTAKGVSQKSMSELKIPIPRNVKEQNIIGTLFSNLDTLITLHQRKLDKLKNLKKAYLNEMFI